ncbi:hypothetical protein J7W19_03410 [Streptomyces mobaraensis NBRC 13819 = DSM 40847]|uniref:Uncharacterized protein n=1 Tax=Streptomyces mobaraensis (strain ATCC 29032 / DSM 40847 / JCM 4168 / NBRC 13819 / NCIMB 11159 / IPCR 16-22) TaxID=1223523 RepID=M3CBM9_STRM1|nr:hypothetical protein [Streptomyces mobaraensis]EMF01391.1 hypothetical protein H340_06576 [Streptomyces mobaraensis NBRC 13819 = DSM 40847]QTT72615.1 hypothetical protein J7W19_03410 [Streptomyces mobaraensis NBRC 13819 = DSM 40847]
MARDRTASTGGGDLLISAAVAEIEGLYTELHGGRGERHRERVLADLARAGHRLAAAALPAQAARDADPARPRSRRERRRLLAARGAELWLKFVMDGGGKGRRRRVLRRRVRTGPPGNRHS